MLASCGADDASSMQDGAPSEGADGGAMDAATEPALDAHLPEADAAETAEDGPAADAGYADASVLRDGGDGDARRPDASSNPDATSVDAPVIEVAGYFSDALGTRLLVRGSDPNGDVAAYTLGFRKGGEEVAVDIDGQGAKTMFAGDLAQPAAQTEFLLTLDLSTELAAVVDALTITIADAAGHASAPRTEMKRATPTRIAGQSCDLIGFTRCANSLCAPTSGSQYVCTPTAAARTAGCNAAQVLQPPEVTTVSGTLGAHSLWDVPAGCAANDPKRRADSVVVLRLASPARKVTLSTRNATTTFDSQLYLLLDCVSDLPECINELCPCADDFAGDAMSPASLQSELTLRDLTAGDHYLVIDSLPSPEAESDAWELTVQEVVE